MATYSDIRVAAEASGLVVRYVPGNPYGWIERASNHTGGFLDRLLQYVPVREPKQIGIVSAYSVGWFDDEFKNDMLRLSSEMKRRGHVILSESIVPYFHAGPEIFAMK